MTRQQLRAALIAVAVAVLVATVLLLLPSPMRRAELDLQCRNRLHRLGQAVIAWTQDHGQARLPPIRNPPAGQAWEPRRPNAIDSVLGPYLAGSIEPQRPGEGEIAFAERIVNADRRLGHSVCCPVTNLPYWWNEAATQRQPTQLALSDEPQVWFFCQRGPEGWPHRHQGREAVHQVSGNGVQTLMGSDDVAALHQRIAALEAAGDRSPALDGLRDLVTAVEARILANGGSPVTWVALESSVSTAFRDQRLRQDP